MASYPSSDSAARSTNAGDEGGSQRLGNPGHTRPSAWPMRTKSIHGRAACHYCGPCGRGLQERLRPSLRSQAMSFPANENRQASRCLRGPGAGTQWSTRPGRSAPSSYVDKATRTENQIRCRSVVVRPGKRMRIAGVLPVDIRNRRWSRTASRMGPGMWATGLTDTVGNGLSGHIPALEGSPPV